MTVVRSPPAKSTIVFTRPIFHGSYAKPKYRRNLIGTLLFFTLFLASLFISAVVATIFFLNLKNSQVPTLNQPQTQTSPSHNFWTTFVTVALALTFPQISMSKIGMLTLGLLFSGSLLTVIISLVALSKPVFLASAKARRNAWGFLISSWLFCGGLYCGKLVSPTWIILIILGALFISLMCFGMSDRGQANKGGFRALSLRIWHPWSVDNRIITAV